MQCNVLKRYSSGLPFSSYFIKFFIATITNSPTFKRLFYFDSVQVLGLFLMNALWVFLARSVGGVGRSINAVSGFWSGWHFGKGFGVQVIGVHL